jgi:hypothetical protein
MSRDDDRCGYHNCGTRRCQHAPHFPGLSGSHAFVEPQPAAGEGEDAPYEHGEFCLGSCDERLLSKSRRDAGHTMCVACQSLWDRAVAAGRAAQRKEDEGLVRERAEDSDGDVRAVLCEAADAIAEKGTGK